MKREGECRRGKDNQSTRYVGRQEVESQTLVDIVQRVDGDRMKEQHSVRWDRMAEVGYGKLGVVQGST